MRGGAPDAHVMDAERRKLTKYADKPADFALVPAVVGMHGEVGTLLHRFLASVASRAADRAGLFDPKAIREFRQRFLHQTRLAISIALARGKARQINVARDKLAGVTVMRARDSSQQVAA